LTGDCDWDYQGILTLFLDTPEGQWLIDHQLHPSFVEQSGPDPWITHVMLCAEMTAEQKTEFFLRF
jgi:hypothetical protein